MYRQDVLRGNGHHPEQTDQQPLDLTAAGRVLAINHRQGFVRQSVGQARLGNRHGERSEQGIGQRNRRAAPQATVERLEGRLDAQTAGQTTHQRADDQRDHHMHAGQAEDQHDANRGNYCINHRYL
ncbi:hypothetical protein D3C80_1522520 [compost metagenome]